MSKLSMITTWMVRLTLIVFLAPLTFHALIWSAHGWPASWRDADWSSAGILPSASESREATILIYSARTGGWKGIFATHSWIVMKRRGAPAYDRYDVVGWGDPVRKNRYPADGRWYGNEPELVVAVDGREAEKLIPAIEAAIANYPWRERGDYRVWPGPNSNTFVASVLADVPELNAVLPPTAVGRDYPMQDKWIGRTPLGGVRLSAGGYLGFVAGPYDGIELNILGLVAGLDFIRPGVKLPGFGRIGL